MIEKMQSKLTTHRGNRRFWIEGGKPLAHGFKPGARFDVKYNKASIVLTLNKKGARKVSGRQRASQKVRMPIVEICSAQVVDVFGRADYVTVSFNNAGSITIKAKK